MNSEIKQILNYFACDVALLNNQFHADQARFCVMLLFLRKLRPLLKQLINKKQINAYGCLLDLRSNSMIFSAGKWYNVAAFETSKPTIHYFSEYLSICHFMIKYTIHQLHR